MLPTIPVPSPMTGPDDPRFTKNACMHRSDHQQRVDWFLDLAGQTRRTEIGFPDKKELEQQLNIILEEFEELCEACGYQLTGDADGDKIFITESGDAADLVEAVDGCLDIAVVVTGLLSKMGVADEALQLEVNNNNLAKFDPAGGGYRRDDGKWIKPPNHPKPQILEILRKQGYTPPEANDP